VLTISRVSLTYQFFELPIAIGSRYGSPAKIRAAGGIMISGTWSYAEYFVLSVIAVLRPERSVLKGIINLLDY
jgi:hypothetical protein